MAHRRSFIGSHDLKVMADAGIQQIRLPLNWASFADALKFLNATEYGSHDPDSDAAVVSDPFYKTTHAFVTVPRKWLANFIKKAGSYGIKVLLDMHAFPGGSSDGTYSGIWPETPRFWTATATIGETSTPLTEVGHKIVEALVSWVEGLDSETFKAVGGLTLMNEPGHMGAWADWSNEDDILKWLTKSAQTFRSSTLPGKGVKLYMNIIGSAFKNFDKVVPWWEQTFDKSERKKWAVMDQHNYMAWGGSLQSGRTTSGGKYFCDDALDSITQVLRTESNKWADSLKSSYPDSLLSITEFSVGTYDQAMEACADPLVIRAFMTEQVASFQKNDIEPYFWTWRMPYGPAFEPGWSLKYILGKETERASPLACMPPRNVNTGAGDTEAFMQTRGLAGAVSDG